MEILIKYIAAAVMAWHSEAYAVKISTDTLPQSDTPHIKIVDTVEQLTQTDPQAYPLVEMLGPRGGIFRYDPAKRSLNDSCTVFDGWVRKSQDPVVNIMWCGAVGDGRADDTEAFHKGLESAYRYRKNNRALYLPSGTYRITRKTVIPARYKGRSNDYFTLYGDGAFDAGQTQLYFEHPKTGKRSDPIEYWIESKMLALTFRDIRFKQLFPKGRNVFSYKPMGLLRAKATSGNGSNRKIPADTDTAIMNCTFARFNTVVENWGRGLRFNDNTASQGEHVIVLHWDRYPEFPKGIGRDSTGFRAFNITGNRFHSNRGYAVVNDGINAHKIHSILISDSLLDIGGGVFKGVLVDGTISNTVSAMTPTPVVYLKGGSRNYQINGLTASGNNKVMRQGKERVPEHFIVLKGKQQNGQFNNINLDNCTGDAIWASGELNGVSFNNLTMNRIGDAATDRLFAFSKGAHRVSIHNVMYSGTRALKSPIKAFGNKQLIRVSHFFAPNSHCRIKREDGVLYQTSFGDIEALPVFKNDRQAGESGLKRGTLYRDREGMIRVKLSK